MMKSIKILPLAAMMTAAFSAEANVSLNPGPRIDFYTSDTEFRSVLVDNILAISYEGNGSEYETMVIECYDATMKINLKDITKALFVPVDKTAYEIDVVDDPHSTFMMLYNFNDPSKPNCVDPNRPYGWRGASAGDPVFFLPDPEKGYDYTYSIKGKYTGYEYTDVKNFVMYVTGDITAQFGIGLDCYCYRMPFEPTLMTMSATEKTDYVGKAFLGVYHGAELKTKGSRIVNGTSDEVTFEFKPNTTFDMKQPEKWGINLIDCYQFDEEKSTFVNVADLRDVNVSPQYLRVKNAISGTLDSRGNLIFQADSVAQPTIDNRRRYYAAPYKSDYTLVAADGISYRYLLEIRPEGADNVYYYFENYGNTCHQAEFEFTGGNTIADPSVGFISYDGERQVKYTYKAGADPVFKQKGSEVGTYTYAGNNGRGDLKLDGFDTATLGDADYAYTLSSAVVTLNMSGTSVDFVIDSSNMTYKELVDDKWEGATIFSTDKAVGAYMAGTEYANCTIRLMMNQTVNGAAAEGKASVVVEIPRTDSSYALTAMAASGKYEYSADGKTITVTSMPVDVVENGSYVYKRRNLTFHLSDDLKSVWLGNEGIGDYLFASSRDGSYVRIGDPTVLMWIDGKAPSEQPDITGTYTATGMKFDYGGMQGDATATLVIGNTTARLTVIAMGAIILESEVAYTFEDNVLTLKDFVVGNGDKFSGITKNEDIIFNYADGSFTGVGSYYGANTQSCMILCLFTDTVFSK